MTFRDRADAGRQLAERCREYGSEEPLVLALPRGGVPVAYEIASALDAQLDLLMVRKIGAPGHPEYGIGAVVDGADHQVVLNDEVVGMLAVPPSYIEKTVAEELAEIERRRAAYSGDRPPVSPRDRTVIIVDDGIATGGTLRAALASIRKAGAAKIVVAVPVAPPEACGTIRPLVDALVVLEEPADFRAVGIHYDDFRQLEDAEVMSYMQKAKR